MIKKILPLIFILSVSCIKISEDNKELYTEKLIIEKSRKILNNLHFNKKEIDDKKLSKNIFNKYISFIDNEKKFILQKDYDKLKEHMNNMIQYFNNEDLNFFDESINILYKRIKDCEKYCEEILNEKIDLTQKEYFNSNIKDKKFPLNEIEQKRFWHSYIKNNILYEMYNIKKDNKIKNQIILKNKAQANVHEHLKKYFNKINKYKREYYFNIYINSFCNTYDPHTIYMPKDTKDEFDFEISGQMEGIGASLQEDGKYIKILDLITGGPAWKSGKINIGDRILSVKTNEKNINLIGYSIKEAVKNIRGKKGTEIILTLLKKDNSINKVKIIRDVIEYTDKFAKSALIKDKYNDSYGLIILPEFYTSSNNNFNKERYPYNDIIKKLKKLNKYNIKGLVIDLRNNGGGSLDQAIKISSIFLGKNPILQSKDRYGKIKILNNSNIEYKFNKPIVVIVNSFSASASEILAASIKDYNRGIILGSKTFGKGTVQSIIPIDYKYGNDIYGHMKITTNKFYRINGTSTQILGVVPHIKTINDYNKNNVINEDIKISFTNDKINDIINKGLKEDIYQIRQLPYIIQNANKRINKNLTYKKINEINQKIYNSSNNDSIPLTIKEFNEFINKKEKLYKAKEDIYKNISNNLNFNVEINDFSYDNINSNSNKNKIIEILKKDLEIEEAINILRDISTSGGT